MHIQCLCVWLLSSQSLDFVLSQLTSSPIAAASSANASRTGISSDSSSASSEMSSAKSRSVYASWPNTTPFIPLPTAQTDSWVNRKGPTAVGTEPIAWDGDLVTAGRTWTLAENNVRDWWAAVHGVPRSLVVLASAHKHAELISRSLRS